jgi:hypothetical protein
MRGQARPSKVIMGSRQPHDLGSRAARLANAVTGIKSSNGHHATMPRPWGKRARLDYCLQSSRPSTMASSLFWSWRNAAMNLLRAFDRLVLPPTISSSTSE